MYLQVLVKYCNILIVIMINYDEKHLGPSCCSPSDYVIIRDKLFRKLTLPRVYGLKNLMILLKTFLTKNIV